jgi:hypothetical protein
MKKEKKFKGHLFKQAKEPEKRRSFVFMKTGKNSYALGLVRYPAQSKIRVN